MVPGPRRYTELTLAQARLVEAFGGRLRVAAQALAARMRAEPGDLMFVVADARSEMGVALGLHLVATKRGPVVVPGLVRELDSWLKYLALYGPVHDCTTGHAGIPVVLIDRAGAMALIRLEG